MTGTRGIAGLLAAVLLAGGVAVASERSGGPRVPPLSAVVPVPAGVSHSHVGPVVMDPSGRRWAVRSWLRPDGGSFPVTQAACLQVGELRPGGLVRTLGTRVRVMRFGDRTVCGETRLGPGPIDVSNLPLVVERLVDDPGAHAPRFVTTLVAGVLPAGVQGVSISPGRLTIDPLSRAFLAVLPGEVRRSALRLTFTAGGHRRTVDFATGQGEPGQSPMVAGTERVAIVLHDTRVRFPLALTVYRVRYQTVRGPITEPCGEPGQIVAGKPGTYNAAWGDFLDSPTLVQLTEFEDSWSPTRFPATNIDSCLNGIVDFTQSPVGGLGVERLSSRLVIVHGFLAPGVTGVDVVPPHGPSFAATADQVSRAFMALMPSTGGVGESAKLVAVGGHPRRRAVTIPLGPYPVPQAFSYRLQDRRRKIHVSWLGGATPFVGVDAVRSPSAIALRVLELFPPEFAPDETPEGIPDVGIEKCANVVLPQPLPLGITVIDGTTGRPAPLGVRFAFRPRGGCPTVRPGQRIRGGGFP